MRARILLVLTVLGALTVVAFAIPLGLAQAESRTREFLLTRDADLQRFASLADSYVTGGPPGSLFEELQAYRDLFDEPIAVVSTRGIPAVSGDLDLQDPEVAGAISRALRNQQDTPVDLLTPFASDRLVLATTTGTDAHINGAVVLAASTAQARADIARSWLFVALGVLASLFALGAFAVAISNWVLRPLDRLSTEITELADALPYRPSPTDLAAMTPEGGGPPELRTLTRTFQRMARTVKGSVQSQRQLVADTAHQLRNPLAALQLRLDALDGMVVPPARAGYERAVTESERLGEILDDLLALSSAEAAQSADRKRAASCLASTVVADRVEFWSGPATAAGVQIRPPEAATDPDVEPLAAIGRIELGQVLDVLLDNACKYAGTGATVKVTVRPVRDESPAGGHPNRIDISVVDTGRGVPGAEIANLTTASTGAVPRRTPTVPPPGEPGSGWRSWMR
jgi:signal transduction histidine kinase